MIVPSVDDTHEPRPRHEEDHRERRQAQGASSQEKESTNVLARWHEQAMAALPVQAAARTLLLESGCADVAVHLSWQLGTPDQSCLDDLQDDDAARLRAMGIPTAGSGWASMLRGGGVVVPTFLPSDPTCVVGFARLTPAQRKHAMVTTPALGLGGPGSAFASATPILAAGVPLALRLAGFGLSNVLLVEQADLLASCASAFAGRRMRLVASKPADLDALRTALAGITAEIETLLVPSGLHGVSPMIAERLGINPTRLPVPAPAPPRTSILLRDLVAYAQKRLGEGQGRAALKEAGLDQIDLITTYGIGYLPADYHRALDRTQRRALVGTRLGGALILPATDSDGHVVDGLVVYDGIGRRDRPLAATPVGLLGGALVTAHADLLMTDTIAGLARLWRAGYRNVLLIRGVEDLDRHVERFVQSGVRTVTLHLRHQQDHAGDVLRTAGISVHRGDADTEETRTALNTMAHVAPPSSSAPTADEDCLPVVIVDEDEDENVVTIDDQDDATFATVLSFPLQSVATAPSTSPTMPPAATSASPSAAALPTLTLVDHDREQSLVTFAAGPVIYTVPLPWDASTRLSVTLRAAGKVFRDTFDVAVEAQRRRFAANAGLTVGIASSILIQQLAALDQAVATLRRSSSPRSPVGETLSPTERTAAEMALRAPDLLDRMMADLTALGCVGEDAQKRALLLAALSRKLDEPVWAAYLAPAGMIGGGVLEVIAAITPPEELLAVSRLSGAALYYAEPDSLRHRLLLIPNADAITDEVAVALRVLHARGALSAAQVARHPTGGRGGTSVVDVRGPVTVLVGADTAEHPLASACLSVPADGSAEHIAELLVADRQRHADLRQRDPAGRATICHRLHALQRLLACRPVVIPFAHRIQFPARSVQHRREHAAFLGLIAASALLHQYQRLSDGAAIIADPRDFAVAQRIAEALGVGEDRDLSHSATQLLRAWCASGSTTVTMAELTALLPDWMRHAFRAALPELVALDYVTSASGGRGKARVYHLAALSGRSTAAAIEPHIRLLPTTMGEVGELAEVGESTSTNFSGDAAMG